MPSFCQWQNLRLPSVCHPLATLRPIAGTRAFCAHCFAAGTRPLAANLNEPLRVACAARTQSKSLGLFPGEQRCGLASWSKHRRLGARNEKYPSEKHEAARRQGLQQKDVECTQSRLVRGSGARSHRVPPASASRGTGQLTVVMRASPRRWPGPRSETRGETLAGPAGLPLDGRVDGGHPPFGVRSESPLPSHPLSPSGRFHRFQPIPTLSADHAIAPKFSGHS